MGRGDISDKYDDINEKFSTIQREFFELQILINEFWKIARGYPSQINETKEITGDDF